MIREIKGYKLLPVFADNRPVDIPALEEMLVKVSQFIEANPQITELDLNPVFAYPDGAIAVDARINIENLQPLPRQKPNEQSLGSTGLLFLSEIGCGRRGFQ